MKPDNGCHCSRVPFAVLSLSLGEYFMKATTKLLPRNFRSQRALSGQFGAVETKWGKVWLRKLCAVGLAGQLRVNYEESMGTLGRHWALSESIHVKPQHDNSIKLPH